MNTRLNTVFLSRGSNTAKHIVCSIDGTAAGIDKMV